MLKLRVSYSKLVFYKEKFCHHKKGKTEETKLIKCFYDNKKKIKNS